MSTRTIRLIPIREVLEPEKVAKKTGRRFAELNKILSKFVTYYQDEELKKAGSPFIWTE